MSVSQRNIDVLRHIVKYCEQIAEYSERFGSSVEKLKSDSAYKDATAMCVLQIGELTKHLSTDFKAAFPGVPWKQIQNMRNIAAHRYGSFSVEYLWDAISVDVPVLLEYCSGILGQYELNSQSAVDALEDDVDAE